MADVKSSAGPPQLTIYPSLHNRTVLISGGASGIGAALVTAFIQQSCTVHFLDIDDPAANQLINHLTTTYPDLSIPNTTLFYHNCDLTSIPSLQHTVSTILTSHPRIDILINNAAADTRRPTSAVTPEFFDAQIAVNLRHVFFLTQQIAPTMAASGRGGSIINIGSISWVIPAVGLPVYTTCKAAIVGLTKTHAKEFGGDGVRVNSILPGGVATERQVKEVWSEGERREMMEGQALKIVLVPEDVSRLACFLGSDDARGVTGQGWKVDGGWT